MCVCSNSLTEAKFHVVSPCDKGKDGKRIQNGLVYLLLFIIVNPQGAGALSRNLTTNLARSPGLLAGL